MAPLAAHMVALISLSAVSSARASSSVLALRHDGAGVFCMLQQSPRFQGGPGYQTRVCVKTLWAQTLAVCLLPEEHNSWACAIACFAVCRVSAADGHSGTPNPGPPRAQHPAAKCGGVGRAPRLRLLRPS